VEFPSTLCPEPFAAHIDHFNILKLLDFFEKSLSAMEFNRPSHLLVASASKVYRLAQNRTPPKTSSKEELLVWRTAPDKTRGHELWKKGRHPPYNVYTLKGVDCYELHERNLPMDGISTYGNHVVRVLSI
jgi:hypothetical protein